MSYRVNFQFHGQNPKIILVGVGGTGSLVADGLCRLLLNLPQVKLLLVDYDRVEPHNLMRQSFYSGDVGKFKSQVIAERLSRQYGRRIAYSVQPFDYDLRDSGSETFYTQAAEGLIIGCVDTPAARRSIAEEFKWTSWWLDAGNGYNSGQVLFGNQPKKEALLGSFNPRRELANNLPLPSLQEPALLYSPDKPAPQRDCAEAVMENTQSPIINHAMATLVLEFVRRIIFGQLPWMAAYIDLNAGTLQTVPATPETIARKFSMKVEDLLEKENTKRR